MKLVTCPTCEKNTPISNYCAFCGAKIKNITVCSVCNKSIPTNISECPHCFTPTQGIIFVSPVEIVPWYIHYFQPFKSSISIIFLLSSYLVFQMILGFIILLLIPQVDIEDPQVSILVNLLIISLSNLSFIFVLVIYSPFFRKREIKNLRNSQGIILLFILFFFSISLLELSLAILENLLDFLSIPPIQSSPYDDYFSSPISTLIFALLATVIAPIFEEIIFRQHVISFLDDGVTSKPVVIFISGIIFSLNHLPADLINGSLRYTIEHLYVVFFLGIILGAIYYKFGLLYSIFLHSMWNIFSLIMEIWKSSPEIIFIYNLSTLIGVIFLLLSLLFSLYYYRRSIHRKWTRIKRSHEFNSRSIPLVGNISIVVSYEILVAFLLFIDQNILSVTFFFIIQILGIIIGFRILEYESKKLEKTKSNIENKEKELIP